MRDFARRRGGHLTRDLMHNLLENALQMEGMPCDILPLTKHEVEDLRSFCNKSGDEELKAFGTKMVDVVHDMLDADVSEGFSEDAVAAWKWQLIEIYLDAFSQWDALSSFAQSTLSSSESGRRFHDHLSQQSSHRKHRLAPLEKLRKERGNEADEVIALHRLKAFKRRTSHLADIRSITKSEELKQFCEKMNSIISSVDLDDISRSSCIRKYEEMFCLVDELSSENVKELLKDQFGRFLYGRLSRDAPARKRTEELFSELRSM